MGLPANAPQVIVNGPDPGDLGAAEAGEADLKQPMTGPTHRPAQPSRSFASRKGLISLPFSAF